MEKYVDLFLGDHYAVFLKEQISFYIIRMKNELDDCALFDEDRLASLLFILFKPIDGDIATKNLVYKIPQNVY